MIDRNRYRNSRYTNAADLTAARTIVTIAGVTEAEVGEEKRLKLVLSFREDVKPLALNITNTDAVCELLGPNEDAWIGKRIALVKARTLFSGKLVDCIRIEAAPSATVAA